MKSLLTSYQYRTSQIVISSQIIMKAVHVVLLISLIVVIDTVLGVETPKEDITGADVEKNGNISAINLNIPVLSDAIAVLDHDDVETSSANHNITVKNVENDDMEEHEVFDDDTLSYASQEINDNDDDLVQINPEYKEPIDTESYDEKFGIESNCTNGNTKSLIEQALGRRPEKIRKFMKQYRVQITMALVVIAFRREIRNFIWDTISKPVHDPQSGKIVGRKFQPIHPTSVLKILLFIHAVRRLQRFGETDNNDTERSPFAPALFLLTGQLSSFAAWMMSDMLSPANPAYIPPVQQHYTFERINHRYQKDVQAYSKAVLDEKVTSLKIQQLMFAHRTIPNMTNTERGNMLYERLFRQGERASRISPVLTSVTLSSDNSTIIILDWTDLDSSLSKLDTLRDEVSYLIHCYDGLVTKADHSEPPKQDQDAFEVVVLLESPGGSASEYALAAQQILRLRQNGIRVTICVDKVAASGGYMIACTSTPGRLFAAPFAVLGSIGVIGQSVNIHKLLEGWGITPLVFRGGKDKAPVGLIGEVTRAGMSKVQTMVDDTHRAFKRHVAESRPIIATRINEIATGDIWLGYDAVDLGLIDRVVTSDEYLGERIRNGARILKLLKIVRGRSIFSKPQTEVLSQLNTQDLRNNRSFLDIISSIRSFLDNAQNTALEKLLSYDNISHATRRPTLRQEQISIV
jgi:signal peptide peptidase SppA